MTKIRDGTENPPISPIPILLSHTDYELLDVIGGPWPSESSLGSAVILVGNEFAVPSQQCVRCNDIVNFVQCSTADKFGFCCQTATLIVGKSKPAGTKVFF